MTLVANQGGDWMFQLKHWGRLPRAAASLPPAPEGTGWRHSLA